MESRIRNILLLSILILNISIYYSQLLIYQDCFHGGVTGGGFSTGEGAGIGTANLNIESGSDIRTAFLFAYSFNEAEDSLLINNTSFLFNNENCITTFSHTNATISPVKLHIIDITEWLQNNFTNNFLFNIQFQSGMPFKGVFCPFIYISYANNSLPLINTSIIVNNENMNGNINYNVQNINTIQTSNPVGFSVYIDRITSFPVDQELIYIEGNLLGALNGPDFVNNLWDAGGVKGHFYYQNNQLFGLDDDTPDQIMGGSDGLADISSYLTNNATTLNFTSQHLNYPNQQNSATNINLAYFLTYTSPCDTFSVSTPNDTTLCQGETIQLNVSGGQAFEWLPATGLSCADCPNPVFTADSSMFYTVRIWNNDTCSVVRPLKINVRPRPVFGALTTTPSECGSNTGTVTLYALPNNGIVTNWQEVGGATQTSNVFQNLSTGNHTFFFVDTNGCQSADTTVFVGEINSTSASFSVSPQSGAVPLSVVFTNTSQNATNFEWFLEGVSVGGSFPNFEFSTSGTFEIMLVAWQNDPTCADTAIQTVVVYDSLIISVPNVFTPNGDGVNDFFEITNSLPVHCELVIVNRWGNIMYEFSDNLSAGSTKLWDGYSLLFHGDMVEGTYFYDITFSGADEQTLELEKLGILPIKKSGFVEVRR